MTTGMKRDQTTLSERERRIDWTWGIIALVVAIILVAVAVYSAKHTGANSAAPGATTGSVQSSGTGEQESVGKFREQVVPNQNKTGTIFGTNPGTQTPGTTVTHSNVPPNAQSQKVGPNGVSENANTGQGAAGNNAQTGLNPQGAGAGNTGISTATDSMGGAATKQMQGQSNPGSSTK